MNIDEITLVHYLILAFGLFIMGMFGIFIHRQQIIMLLMSIELMLLGINVNFIAFSYYLNDLHGQVFVFFILTVIAAETAVGLSIFMNLFRSFNILHVKKISNLKG